LTVVDLGDLARHDDNHLDQLQRALHPASDPLPSTITFLE